MIVVCGEALIDQFLARTDRARADLLAVAGGSPFNVAIGISRQGIKSAFHGGISKDPFGEMLAGCLQRDKVSLKLAHRSGRPTPLMIVATDPAGVPTYTFHGERAAHTDLPVMKLPAEVEAITFGSFSIAADPAGETYVKLAEAEAGNRVISIDPNVRPMAITDMALWEERFHRILKTATIVKASIEDIELLYGHGASVAKVAENWRSEGPALVIVTYGEGGAVGYGGGEPVKVSGRPVEVVDTVGAGDTFHAALLSELSRRGKLTPKAVRSLDRETLTAILRYAAIAASITCTRRGADLPTAAEVAAVAG